MDRPPAAVPSVALLFGELVELSSAERAARLAALETSAPLVARELRALLEVDADGSDFFGLNSGAPGAQQTDSTPDDVHAVPGGTIGPYQLLQELGRGGMGTVWLARDARLDRQVALKFLRLPESEPGARAADARREIRSRFLIEARAAAALDHPNVASIYDVGGASEDRLFIAMAHCAGGSLAQRLMDGALGVTEAVRVATGVAAGLAAAHRRGVIHRDIKPANVLFDAEGTPRLADFGIALLPDHTATRSGVLMGTLAYLSPEQLRGERADHRADLWALGVTLYEMLAGVRPFSGDSHASIMHAVLYATPAPLESLAPATPPSLLALVEQLLAKDASRRPESAAVVEAALRRGTPPAPVSPSRAGLSDATLAPIHLTTLIGRTRELRQVQRLLTGTRLLTLTGAGGSGKTRLAAETLARVAFRAVEGERTAWVDLTPLTEAPMVAVQIAAALRVPELPNRSRLDAVADTIGNTQTLLVLDNCEQVVTAAAEAAHRLLQRCPQLRILATSREALAISGETTWLVPAMDEQEARDLFVARANAALPGFALNEENSDAILEICRRLDGIPLAIELAAARVRILSPAQIAARLDDAFQLLTGGSRTALPRHRTLRGTMDWSHALLIPRDRVLLRRLAVFSGGFTMAAAESVCADAGGDATRGDDALAPMAVLDSLSSLVEKSLVVLDADGVMLRYRLLETVRQYAREQLIEAGELAACARRHAAHFLALTDEYAPIIEGGEHRPGLIESLIPDDDNIRTAVAWTIEGDPADDDRASMALRFAANLFWYWYSAAGWLGTAQYGEARRFVTAAIARGDRCDPVLRGRALATSGFIGLSTGDWEHAVDAISRGLALLRAHGEPARAAFVQSGLAAAHLMRGEVDAAWRNVDEAYRVAQTMPTSVLHTFCTSWVGLAARARGDVVLAREMQERNTRFAREIGHQTSLSHSHAFLGALNLDAGLIEAAADNFRVAVPLHLQLRDGWGLALDLEGLSGVAAARGAHADSVRLLGAVDAWREKIGLGIPTFEVEDRDRRVHSARQRLGSAYEMLYAEGRLLSPAEAAALVMTDGPGGMGQVPMAGAETERAHSGPPIFIVPPA